MEKIKKLITLTAIMVMFGSQVQGQQTDCCAPTDDCAAYCDSGRASYLSAALPIGALAVAAIIIATTNRHHHHSSSTCCSPTSCPSPTIVHAHSACNCF